MRRPSFTLAIYHAMAALFGPDPRQSAAAHPDTARPDGPLIWLHTPRSGDRALVTRLIEEVRERQPGADFMITTAGRSPLPLPDGCIFLQLPVENRRQVSRFLEHWRPAVAVWLSGRLRPALLAAIAGADVPLFMFDTGNAINAARGTLLVPGLRKATLRLFDGILAGDTATEDALRKAGAHWDRIENSGVLESGIEPIGCNEAERDAMAQALAARPVWLAARVNADELDAVLGAHVQALRRAHRLLLLVVPEDPADGPRFAAIIAARDLIFAQRSSGEEPDRDTQVYLADTEGEMGLWYRLSPITFVGQTLTRGSATGPNPFEAAALGSAVLHGPGTGPFGREFSRLSRAGASRLVMHSGELGLAVESLLSPDRAAEMAHAAWAISSAGADVMDRAVELIDAAMNRPAGAE